MFHQLVAVVGSCCIPIVIAHPLPGFLLDAAVFLELLWGVVFGVPWVEWCPDPLQPQHQWIKIFAPGPWVIGTSNDPIPSHAYREWKCEPLVDGNSDRQPVWHRRDWITEGYRRIAPPQPQHQHRWRTAWPSATSADVAATLDTHRLT